MNEHIEQAERDYGAKRFNEAANGYIAVIAADPRNVAAYSGLVRALINLKQYDKAISTADKGLEIDPQYASLHGNMGFAYLNLGRLSESEAKFREAVALQPNLMPAQFGLAYSLLQQKRYQEAATQLRTEPLQI